MKKLVIGIISFAMIIGAAYAYKQYKNKESKVCVSIDSKNDLEVCEFSQATVILSRGGQSVLPKQAQSAPGAAPSQALPVAKPAEKK